MPEKIYKIRMASEDSMAESIEDKTEGSRPIDSMTRYDIKKKLEFLSKKYHNNPEQYIQELKKMKITPAEVRKYNLGKKR